MILAVLLASIIGTKLPAWPAKLPADWVQGGPLTLADLHGKVVLIRFFTDASCPFCRATAPALNEFHREFAPRGLVVIGMYTPKPRPRALTLDVVRETVDDYGFEFPVVLDADWSALRRLWLDHAGKSAFTSASLLIDRRGILRHVQEGGVYAKDSDDPKARGDYKAMSEEIVRLLAEAP